MDGCETSKILLSIDYTMQNKTDIIAPAKDYNVRLDATFTTE